MSPETFASLVATALVAGFIDAVAGGGGLLTVPALALAGLDPVSAIATNKLQGSFGTGAATFAFARGGHLAWKQCGPLALASAVGSIAGATVLTHIPVAPVAALLPFVLIGLAIYFAFAPAIGDVDRHQRLSMAAFTLLFVPLIGAYDGIFGPGAGSFFMLGFVGLLGYGVVRATAHTKVANFASNLAALATFAFSGHIVWGLGLAMGAAQILGSSLGAHSTMRQGAKLVRPLIVCVCIAAALRLAATPGNPAFEAVIGWFGRR